MVLDGQRKSVSGKALPLRESPFSGGATLEMNKIKK